MQPVYYILQGCFCNSLGCLNLFDFLRCFYHPAFFNRIAQHIAGIPSILMRKPLLQVGKLLQGHFCGFHCNGRCVVLLQQIFHLYRQIFQFYYLTILDTRSCFFNIPKVNQQVCSIPKANHISGRRCHSGKISAVDICGNPRTVNALRQPLHQLFHPSHRQKPLSKQFYHP